MLSNKEGSCEKMIVQGLESSLDVLLGCNLVELHDTHCGEHLGTAGGEDLVIIHAHPLDNLCAVSRVSSSSELIICHKVGNGIGFCQKNSIGSLKSWDLAEGELL